MNNLQIEYNFSASDLIKRSCSQIVYLHNKQKQIYTDMMQNGTKYQEKIIEFYKNKINHIYFYNYDIARKFDYQFKWKEYDFLNQYFTYKKI